MSIWLKKIDSNRCISQAVNLHMSFDNGIDSEVKRACTDFKKWLQKEYIFPVYIKIYIKNKNHIRARDGDFVSATCFLPFEQYNSPYIKVAVGDYTPLLQQQEKDCELSGILHSIAHELTHYYQWIKDIEPSEIQAIRCADYVIKKYANTREHPWGVDLVVNGDTYKLTISGSFNLIYNLETGINC